MDLDYADDVVLLSSILDSLVDALAILGEEASPLSLTNDKVYARAGTPLLVTTTIKRGRMHLLDNVVHLDERVLAKQVLLAASRPPPWGWSRP